MLKINSMCPDFQCKTTEGDISFHEWLGDSWGVLFSHPKDFTPVCTTELGSLGQMKAEFDARNVKVIGLSVDGVEDHKKWLNDIKDVSGTMPDYPIIADEDLKLRGPGEFFGLRQSGFFQFKIADMVQDGSLLRQARLSAFNLIDNDQSLELEVNKRLKEWFITDYASYLGNIKLS